MDMGRDDAGEAEAGKTQRRNRRARRTTREPEREKVFM
jgi:hypothetical protein